MDHLIWVLITVSFLGIVVGFFIFKKPFLSLFLKRMIFMCSIWDWIKCVVYCSLSISLVFAGFERWYYFRDDLSHSKNLQLVDLSYADQIEVEAYLISEENVSKAFLLEGFIANEDWSMHSFDQHNKRKTFYKVIRIKNKGGIPICGILKSSTSKEFRRIEVPPLPPYMSEFKNIVLCGDRAVKKKYKTPLKLFFEWERLYFGGLKNDAEHM